MYCTYTSSRFVDIIIPYNKFCILNMFMIFMYWSMVSVCCFGVVLCAWRDSICEGPHNYSTPALGTHSGCSGRVSPYNFSYWLLTWFEKEFLKLLYGRRFLLLFKWEIKAIKGKVMTLILSISFNFDFLHYT